MPGAVRRAQPTLVVLILSALLLAACGATDGADSEGVAEPAPREVQTPSDAVAPTTPPTSPTSPPLPTATPVPPPPTAAPVAAPALQLDFGVMPTDVRGVVAVTGIPVAVLGATDEGYLVRTPCGGEARIAGATPLGPIDVVIDPGHGGRIDTGAVGPAGLVESHLNLDVARAARDLLVEQGIGVVLTREGEYLIPLSVRAQFADDLGAQIMVSIHHNAPTPNPSATPGTETFVQDDPRSRRLGGLLQESVVEALSGFPDIAWSSAPDAGVLRVLNSRGVDAYGMMRRPATPTALVELAYLNNPAEEALLATDAYVDVAGAAVADAIVRWLTTDDPGTGYIDEPRVFDPAFAPGADVCTEPLL